MAASDTRETPVWDLPTRVFHWSLVVLVGVNLFMVAPRGGGSTVIHFVAGYCIAGLVLFRLAWGFVGSPRSRFADFVHRWPTVKAYIGRLQRFDPPHSVGHNPLGGWMILVLLSTLIGMTATGLFAASRRAAGPLAHLIPIGATGVVGSIHSFLSDILIAFIVVHIAGVAGDWLLTGDNLVRAMLTGRKRLPAETASEERPVAPIWRAATIGVISLLLVGALAMATDYTRTRNTLPQTPASQSAGAASSAQ